MNKKTIWWRLTTVACWLMVLTLAVYAAWGEIAVHRGTTWKPLEVLLIPLSFLITLPKLYLTCFSLWHWKYRYRGSNPVAWAVAFAVAWGYAFRADPLAWAIALPSAWAYAPALVYYTRHIHRDIKGAQQYGSFDVPSVSSMPSGRCGTFAQVFRILGSILLGWASLTAITGTVSYWVLFDKFDRCATQNIGKTLSVGEVEAIHYAHLVNEVMVALLCVAAITGAAGGILLAMSNNLRWRLKEHEEQRTPYQPQGEQFDAAVVVDRVPVDPRQ